ncbi:MAG: 50S ribosomal protein L11 methyltransferase [Candidatus Thermoplasmatota archaeon]|nr:50S ribosomal protein L11 methyltransferase [Candidatus Thermoplasmatota archaeon]
MRLRQLSMLLSRLEKCDDPDVSLEQYTTSGELAARWIFDIAAFGDLSEGSTIIDLGCGNGILGIAALHLAANKAILIDSDSNCCDVSRRNTEKLEAAKSCEVLEIDVSSLDSDLWNADLVISNPPWGRQKEKADAPFLDLIESIGAVTHIMHSSNAKHIRPRFEEAGWGVEMYGEADFAIPASFEHHRSSRGVTKAGFWRLTPP